MRLGKLITLSKFTDLLPYYNTMVEAGKLHNSSMIAAQYAKTREVTMQLFLGRSENFPSKLMAKIKCPINPLPVRGEFECPSEKVLIDFLNFYGWSVRNTIDGHLLK